MSKLHHTPGPWENHYGLIVNERQAAPVICSMFGKDEQDFPNAPANARLISAAPDMLDALIMSYRIAIDLPCECDEYYGVVCGLHKWIRTLRDTIESATGLPIEEVLK